MSNPEIIWSVSEVNKAVRDLVEGSLLPFWINGEVGSLTVHRSGHVYFTLKDNNSQLRAVFFNGANECEKLKIKNGDKIEGFGNLTVYEVRGEYQISLRKIRVAGLGALQQRFEEIKNKLAAEGLFDEARKRPIPLLPQRIGVITSPGGAALKDFLQIINRRFPNINIRIYPCAVQGQQAAAEVVRGIEFFNRCQGADVLVITRGGGSMEDLWPFNEEILARTVADSAIPVISAVGHEIDFTICDFAADLRVPTPSAAAELVIGQREELATRIERARKDIFNVLAFRAGNLKARLDTTANSFVFKEPGHLLKMRGQQLDELELRCSNVVERQSGQMSAKLDNLEAMLSALNPTRQLERGFSIIIDPATGKVISSALQMPGKKLAAKMADGTLNVTVDGDPDSLF